MLCLYGCRQSAVIDPSSVKVRQERETVLFYIDTTVISSYSANLTERSVSAKMAAVTSKLGIQDLQSGWSCKLILDIEKEDYFSLSGMERALNELFNHLGYAKHDEATALKFVHEKLFEHYTAANGESKPGDWDLCESEYKRRLSALQLKGSTELVYRGLDSCQIEETLSAAKAVDDLSSRQYLLTVLTCHNGSREDNDFIINKPYVRLTFSGESHLKIEIDYLNETSAFAY